MASRGVYSPAQERAKYSPRSWTQPSQSSGPMRLGVVNTGLEGSSAVTDAFSSVTRSCGRAISIGYGA